MPGKPPIVARATQPRPEDPSEPSALELLAEGFELLAERLQALEQRPVAKDGVGVVSGLVDRGGALVLTLTSGQTITVGKVVSDAPAAADVADMVMERLKPLIAELREEASNVAAARESIADLVDRAVAALPKPKDGESVDPAVVSGMVADRVAAAISELPSLVDAAIKNAISALPRPKDGESVTIEDVRPLVEEAVAAIPKPKDGESVDPDIVAEMISAEVGKAVAALPPAKDGKSVDPAAVEQMVAEKVRAAVSALPKPKDGESVDPATVAKMVADAVAEIPRPKDGESVTLDDVRPVIEESVAKAVAAIPVPKDGVGISDMIVTNEGRLAVVLTSGKRVDAGVVVPEAVAGPAGRSVTSGHVDDTGHLILQLSDESEIDVGEVKGPPGEAVKGEPGRGVADASIVDGALILTFTDKTKAALGRVVGRDGTSPKAPRAIKGDPGPAGGLKVLELGPAGHLTANDLASLREIEVEAVSGETIRLYGRA